MPCRKTFSRGLANPPLIFFSGLVDPHTLLNSMLFSPFESPPSVTIPSLVIKHLIAKTVLHQLSKHGPPTTLAAPLSVTLLVVLLLLAPSTLVVDRKYFYSSSGCCFINILCIREASYSLECGLGPTCELYPLYR